MTANPADSATASGVVPVDRVSRFEDAGAALAELDRLYRRSAGHLADWFQRFAKGEDPGHRVRAHYPFVRIDVPGPPTDAPQAPFGYANGAGRYATTLTRPDLFADYYRQQLDLLLQHHDRPLEIGVSSVPIPIHFALGEGFYLEGTLTQERAQAIGDVFDLPDLFYMDDHIANGTLEPAEHDELPLALFTAPRVDLSLQRLRHYTGTSPRHFQGFVLFTNYQFYVDDFIQLGTRWMTEEPQAGLDLGYTAFVQPGDRELANRLAAPQAPQPGQAPARLPQMPAYHLKRDDGLGITLVNIGVGPANAKTITDHLAVLRPHAWIMLGHCAGLRNTQRLGDYVLAHGYVREDQVLDQDLPISTPLPPLGEVQKALEQAVGRVSGLVGQDVKQIMRTGTVATVGDRNWELRDYREPIRRFSQSRAIALDMESATIAANGFRFRVPYGTLLCVSDKPLHGQLKLPGMADRFYRERVDQHLRIGLEAMEILRDSAQERVHTRKLRSFNEPAFR